MIQCKRFRWKDEWAKYSKSLCCALATDRMMIFYDKNRNNNDG